MFTFSPFILRFSKVQETLYQMEGPIQKIHQQNLGIFFKHFIIAQNFSYFDQRSWGEIRPFKNFIDAEISSVYKFYLCYMV